MVEPGNPEVFLRFPEHGRSCVNCGFAGRWNWPEGGKRVRELDFNDRSQAFIIPLHVPGDEADIGEQLHCWIGAAELDKEFDDAYAHHGDNAMQASRDVLRRSREHCGQFYPWTEFLSFKEHREEQQVFLMRQSDRDFERQISSSANRTQIVMAGLVALGIVVSVALSVFGTSTTVVKGVVPVSVTTPTVVTTQSSPDTSSGQPSR